ncbi:MAG TPA: hypothetical protein VFW45_04885 [Candidatus Polarisedimenticolia bacterium]|nr:hypothetical protein [Candidatus Polarisedimenticolia bacterium]
MKPSLAKRRGAKAKRRGASASGRVHGHENLVADIVDQITRKQTKEAKQSKGTARRRGLAGTCSFCLDSPVAASPYRVVLKCDTGDNSRSGH